ncbi:f-box domain containing protein [Moniliophthora roreri MCA 2997]|uniref:F-box domain containing protein n=2 Tax=Moniliophthora roreri TaxID=221103 RepID=V2WRZ5_MONRO|nr:f-box domain containing protein [Moniliophthora roreri MCA 2997]
MLLSLSELALVNLDKRQVIDPYLCGYGCKLSEVVLNGMTRDILWLFTIPLNGQELPSSVGSWAGDRVLILDEYAGRVSDYFNPGEYEPASSNSQVLDYVLEHFTPIKCPKYRGEKGLDMLFPNNHVWVARNFDKKWYVRSDVLIRKPSNRVGPYNKEGLGFGDFFLAVLGAAGMPMPGYCGGDRFDLRSMEEVMEEDGWADKSLEALAGVDFFSEEHFGYGRHI